MIVTISREYGAAGNPVAHGVAEALGYELFDDHVPAAVASALGTSAEEVSRRAEQPPTLVERFVGSLAAATPELLIAHAPMPDEFDGNVRAEIERHVREAAAAGDVVIFGRCGSAIVGARSDVVRVFLIADPTWRAERVASSLQCSMAAAHAELSRVDVARRRFARERYGFGWGDPHAYDLVIDVSRLGIDGTIGTIVTAVDAARRRLEPDVKN